MVTLFCRVNLKRVELSMSNSLGGSQERDKMLKLSRPVAAGLHALCSTILTRSWVRGHCIKTFASGKSFHTTCRQIHGEQM